MQPRVHVDGAPARPRRVSRRFPCTRQVLDYGIQLHFCGIQLHSFAFGCILRHRAAWARGPGRFSGAGSLWSGARRVAAFPARNPDAGRSCGDPAETVDFVCVRRLPGLGSCRRAQACFPVLRGAGWPLPSDRSSLLGPPLPYFNRRQTWPLCLPCHRLASVLTPAGRGPGLHARSARQGEGVHYGIATPVFACGNRCVATRWAAGGCLARRSVMNTPCRRRLDCALASTTCRRDVIRWLQEPGRSRQRNQGLPDVLRYPTGRRGTQLNKRCSARRRRNHGAGVPVRAQPEHGRAPAGDGWPG